MIKQSRSVETPVPIINLTHGSRGGKRERGRAERERGRTFPDPSRKRVPVQGRALSP